MKDESPTLEELAQAQNVKPMMDVSALFGTWPGEVDDGFEESIDEMRRDEARVARWADLHAESERHAINAQTALWARDNALALDLYASAARAEQQALDQLDPSKSRTRGVIAVSAVALWFKATNYLAAEQLAHALLAGGDIPAFAREELRNLVQAIRIESAKQEAGVK